MANFLPFKKYILTISDQMIGKHGLSGPFLDIGGGRGDVSLHYAKRGWSGVFLDRSPEAVDAARKTLRNFPNQLTIVNSEIAEIEGTFGTVFLFDVIEHVEDDAGLLAAIRNKLRHGGALIISVPTNPSEWRWDDDYYGHLRRYDPGRFVDLLAAHGFKVVENVDITFPFFWLLRRFYTRILSPRISSASQALRRTEISSLNNSWHISPVINYLAQSILLWWPLLLIQPLFKRTTKGHERMFVATVE